MSAKERIDMYLRKRRIYTNRFFGKCIIGENGKTYISDILSKEEGNLLLREDGDRLSLRAELADFLWSIEEFYEFSIYIPDIETTEDVVVIIDTKKELPFKVDFNPYQEIVRLRYERLDNPEANKMIAHLMREIGKGLYSSKQRMVFELIQNADDTPAGEDVSFHVDAQGDYLLIMHNGTPFNQEDVEAITSAAESTKRHDKKKTGYKGIGFKSVFTDSEEVIIKSGSFLFSFRRNHPAYRDFDSFYFGKKRYSDYPKLLEEDKLKFAKQRKNFNGNTDIPWQLIPIWTKQIPPQLESSGFVTFNNNVGIAINFGNEKVKDYLFAISDFAMNPHFMLFLRHVNIFKSLKDKIVVRKTGDNPVKIERSSSNKKNLSLQYFKKIMDDIPVSDEALANEGIRIYKKQRKNEYGEIYYFFSTDIEGEKPIESIPPKLASFEATTIIFAAPIIDNNLQAEPAYLKNEGFSSFYTYLPMKEIRIKLPFLVNADFVPSSDREELQGDNRWNEYIISKIAYNHLSWMKEIAQNGLENHKFHKEYLSLLLKDWLPNDFTINLLVDKYNKVYKKALDEIDFVLSDNNTLCNINQIIIDHSGISMILGTRFFYRIAETSKRLPHQSLNISYLEYNYLGIEKYKSSLLTGHLSKETNRKMLAEELSEISLDNYKNFLLWLNDFCAKNDSKPNWVLDLPIVRTTRGVFSINETLELDDIIIRNSMTNGIEDILIKLGYECTEVLFDDYKRIYSYTFHFENYLNRSKLIYNKIASNSNLSLLSPLDKNELLKYFENLEQPGEVRYTMTLPIFNSRVPGSSLKSLNNLISNQCPDLPVWLHYIVIDPEEEKHLFRSFSKHLIKQNNLLVNVFCKFKLFEEIVTNLVATQINEFYTYVLRIYDINPPVNKEVFLKIPWLYASKTKLFRNPQSIYCPESIQSLDFENYEIIRSVIETCSDEIFADYASLPLVKLFTLGCKNGVAASVMNRSGDFDINQLKSFFEWLSEKDDKEFFTKYNVLKINETSFTLSMSQNHRQFYSANDSLCQLIENENIDQCNLLPFPKELYSEKLISLGILAKNDLLNYLIMNGFAKKSFVQFVYNSAPIELSQLYIEKLHSLDLISSNIYTKETDEYKIIDIILDIGRKTEGYYESIISKINIDGNPYGSRGISDDVYFEFKGGALVKKYELSLSEILPSYKERSSSVTKIIEAFSGLSKTELVNFFKLSRKSHRNIFEEIHTENSEYLSPTQVLFLMLFKEETNEMNVSRSKPLFSKHLFHLNNVKYELNSIMFLDLCFKINYPHYSNVNLFPDFSPNNTLAIEEYAIDSECPPKWVTQWLDTDTKREKLEFLYASGLNSHESAVVNLRKSILDCNESTFQKSIINLDNDLLLKNTVLWLYKQQENNSYSPEVQYLKALYAKLSLINVPLDHLLIPVVNGFNGLQTQYRLYSYNPQDSYYMLNEGWGDFKENIFNHLKNDHQLIIDDLIPDAYLKILSPIKGSIQNAPNEIKLINNSEPFKENFYLEWKDREKYKIRIYNGEALPRVIQYNNIVLKEILEGSAVNINDEYYVSRDEALYLPHSLKGILPDAIRWELEDLKAEYDKKKSQIKNKLEYDDEEVDVLIRLFGNEIPKIFYKDLNLVSMIKALIYLKTQGYNVDDAEANIPNSIDDAQLRPVYPPGYHSSSNQALTIKCRSAKGGLLYLRASVWEELNNKNNYLYILTGNSYTDCRLCKSREEIISDKKADYLVLRIEASSEPDTIDSILQGKYEKSNIWLIIRVNENNIYKSIFEKIRRKEENDDSRNINLGDETID